MKDDSMSLVFLTCRTFDAILGHIPFWMMFTDLHGVTWSFLLVRCASGRWPIRHFYDDSSVETLGSHPVRPALLGISMSPCFPLWDAFWTLGLDFVIDLDDQDHAFDERWFHVTCSSDLSHIWCHTRAYFHYGWDLWIFTEVTCSTIDDFMSPVLLTCHTSDAILGHISISDEIYGSSRRSHVRW